MNIDEEGLLDEPCLSCDKAYVEDIWHSWCCDEKECPYESQESESKRYAELAKSFTQGLRAGLTESAEWIDDKCSVCGKGIEDLIDSSDWYQLEDPKYCPFCGREIIKEG